MKLSNYFKIASAIFIAGNLSAQSQQFTTTGASNFVAPAGVVTVKVECVGAGGAGGRVTPSNFLDTDAAGGGGGGAYAMNFVPVIAGDTYAVEVGLGGKNDGTSIDGGDSFFGDGTIVRAAGGKTRTGNDNVPGVEGGLATNSIGIIKYSGGNGGNGNESDVNGGGGGGAAGSTGAGFDGVNHTGGAIRPNFGGNGGQGGLDGANGAAGGTFGGGGGGSSANGSNNRNGGNGGNGVVQISWSLVTSFTPQNVCSSETVTVYGVNFIGVDSVFVGATSVSFTQINDTTVTFTIPQTATSGQITVSTSVGKSISAQTLTIVNQSVSITQSGMTLTANYNGSSQATYQWIDCLNGNSPIANATNPTYTATQNGLYAVTIVENQCSITSTCFTINSASLSENEAMNLNVYPNPTTNKLTIDSEELIQSIQITDQLGRVMHNQPVQHNQVMLSIQELATGNYWLEVNTDAGTSIVKISKQ